MQWIEVENSEDKKTPKWIRSCDLSREGLVFVPAAMAGNESEIFLCAGYDGTPVAHYLNHFYVPADWLAIDFPKVAETCETISKKVCETFL